MSSNDHGELAEHELLDAIAEEKVRILARTTEQVAARVEFPVEIVEERLEALYEDEQVVKVTSHSEPVRWLRASLLIGFGGQEGPRHE